MVEERLSRRRLVRWVALAAAVAALAAPGCPFTPRDAPQPCIPGVDPGCCVSAQFRDPTLPTTVRDNIVAALKKGGNTCLTIEPNYRESLDSVGTGFQYFPDAEALALAPSGCPTFFTNWNHAREVQFMLSALSSGSGSSLPDTIDFAVAITDTLERTNVFRRYNVQYLLTLRSPGAQEEPRQTERYGGCALWDVVVGDSGFWVLRRWEDVQALGASPDCVPVLPVTGTVTGTIGVFKALRGTCR